MAATLGVLNRRRSSTRPTTNKCIPKHKDSIGRFARTKDSLRERRRILRNNSERYLIQIADKHFGIPPRARGLLYHVPLLPPGRARDSVLREIHATVERMGSSSNHAGHEYHTRLSICYEQVFAPSDYDHYVFDEDDDEEDQMTLKKILKEVVHLPPEPDYSPESSYTKITYSECDPGKSLDRAHRLGQKPSDIKEKGANNNLANSSAANHIPKSCESRSPWTETRTSKKQENVPIFRPALSLQIPTADSGQDGKPQALKVGPFNGKSSIPSQPDPERYCPTPTWKKYTPSSNNSSPYKAYSREAPPTSQSYCTTKPPGDTASKWRVPSLNLSANKSLMEEIEAVTRLKPASTLLSTKWKDTTAAQNSSATASTVSGSLPDKSQASRTSYAQMTRKAVPSMTSNANSESSSSSSSMSYPNDTQQATPQLRHKPKSSFLKSSISSTHVIIEEEKEEEKEEEEEEVYGHTKRAKPPSVPTRTTSKTQGIQIRSLARPLPLGQVPNNVSTDSRPPSQSDLPTRKSTKPVERHEDFNWPRWSDLTYEDPATLWSRQWRERRRAREKSVRNRDGTALLE